MEHNISERYLWDFINWCGWYWWWGVALLSAWNLWGLYKLAPPTTTSGAFLRVVQVMAFFLMAAAPWNTAFGPLALPFLLISVRGVNHQLYLGCVAAGKVAPVWRTIGERLHVVTRPKPQVGAD